MTFGKPTPATGDAVNIKTSEVTPSVPFPAAGRPSDPAVVAKSRKMPKPTWPLELPPIQQLRFAAGLSAEQQRGFEIEIDLAFQDFLAADPGRGTFCEVMRGLVFTPGMLFTAIKSHH